MIIVGKLFLKEEFFLMRWIACFMVASVCLYADTSIFSSQSEREARINQLEKEISVHQQRARFAEREAMRLLPLDFSASRRYLRMQERNEQQAAELQRELDRLQGKR